MELEEMNRVLEEVWKNPSLSDVEKELEEQPKQRKKRFFFLGERKVIPENPVIFENGIFFVERASEFMVIKPKTVKEYLQMVRGTKRMTKVEKVAKEILIPLSQTNENPIRWFEQKYVESNGERNMQGRFIREIWKYKKEVFGGAMLG